MFKFIEKVFFTSTTSFSFNPLSVNSLQCVSMKNQKCKIKSELVNANSNEPLFYPYSIKRFL